MANKIINLKELRAILAEEIVKLREQKTTPANVNAITNATGKILSTVKLDLEYHKIIGKKPEIDFIEIADSKASSKNRLTEAEDKK